MNQKNIKIGCRNFLVQENVTLQSKAANRNSKEYAGQLGFEQKIKSFLDNSSDGKVYFEIEEMYLEEKLGRRIYIKFIHTKRDDIHVFILDDRQRDSMAFNRIMLLK